MTEFEINQIPALMLAYYGDAVIGLMARKRIIESGVPSVRDANAVSKQYVTLEAQSDAFARIDSMLTDWESAVYRRARNHSSRTPNHGSAAQYHRATGFEALFGALWLSDDLKRAEELFEAAYPKKQAEKEGDIGEA